MSERYRVRNKLVYDIHNGYFSLFVYGTLKENGSAHMFLEDDTKYVKKCRTTCDYSLYHMGAYPAMVLEPSKNGVCGELYAVYNKSLFSTLDKYECHPHLFVRSVIELEGGLKASGYLLCKDRVDYMKKHYNVQKIESGEWGVND